MDTLVINLKRSDKCLAKLSFKYTRKNIKKT